MHRDWYTAGQSICACTVRVHVNVCPKMVLLHLCLMLLTLGACAARVTVLGLCVCLPVTAILPPRTIRRLTRGTSGYSATCTRLLKRRFLYKCFVNKLGRYLLTAKKSAIFTLVRLCEAILNIDTHDVICKRSLQILYRRMLIEQERANG